VDAARRLVAFRDETSGPVHSWKWTFGDGTVSTEQNPIHQYAKGGDYIVDLEQNPTYCRVSYSQGELCPARCLVTYVLVL
jgi:hypothetical protein